MGVNQLFCIPAAWWKKKFQKFMNEIDYPDAFQSCFKADGGTGFDCFDG